MKWAQTILIFIIICCNTMKVSAQNITIDDSYTAQQLVEKLVNTSCANVSGFIVSGDTFTTGKNSYGYFTNTNASFPFTDGVVLSTWSADNAVGPFVRNLGGGSSLWLGDTNLDQAIGTTSKNATLLEFDFTPLTNFLSFEYIFASNEYQDDFPCEYSDGFAFLIKEKGSTSAFQNLAVIPKTTTPVSSKNIHPAIRFVDFGNIKSCPALNESFFGGSNTSTTNTSPINYAGQTVVMNAQTNVIAGKTYQIKLIIADDKNEYYDSAIFLKAGSFAPKIDLGQDRLLTNNPICFGDSYTINTQLLPAYTYNWYKDGVLIPGKTDPFLTVTDTAKYRLEVELGNPNCTATGEIRIEFTPEILLSNTTLVQCDDNSDGVSIFDLSRVDNFIKNNNASLSPIVYYESLADAQGKINPILTPTTYTNKPTVPILFGRVSNSYGCANYAQLSLTIANNSIAPLNTVSTCDEDSVQDGLYQFDLNAQISPQILSSIPAGMIIEYYLNSTDAISQKNPLPNIFKNTTPNQQIIQARIVNGPDCYGIVPVTLNVITFNPSDFQDETTSFCIGSTTDLSVASGYSDYLWNTGATTNSITINAAGSYSVTVKNTDGCTAMKKFIATSSGIATITDATINDFAGKENTVLLDYMGIGDYEFSLDGSYFQDNPQFMGIAPGSYFATARDKNGCGLSAPYTVYVLDYPRFFTPNGDGYNDFWEIKNLDLFPKAIISIYDRYGKLLKQLNTINSSWNGKYNGTLLPTDDYWFHLNFSDGKIIKGHFSLKR